MTLQHEMTPTTSVERRPRSSTRRRLLVGGLCLLAVAGVVLLTFVNLTLALAAAVALLAVAVALLARSRGRLIGQIAAQRAPRDAATELEPGGDGATVPLRRPDPHPDEAPTDVPTTTRRDPAGGELTLFGDPLSSAQLAAPPEAGEPASEPVPVSVAVRMPDQPTAIYVVVSNVVLGRGRRAGLSIDDPTVSRSHAALIWRDERWCLRSESDGARTAVNGVAVRGDDLVPLADGDEVELGARGAVLEWGVTVPGRPTYGTAVELTLLAAANTTPGTRQRNEDDYLVGPSLVAVADGAGGEPAGATASGLAIRALQSAEALHRPLPELVAAANGAVLAGQSHHPTRAGMASTLDIARLIRQGGVWILEIAHLGDGVVLLQKPGGSVHRLTTPHRSVSRDGRRTWLDRALGTELDTEAQYDRTYAEVGQRLILATDGLLDHFGEDRLIRKLFELRESSPRHVADELVRTAVEENVRDNVTVVVADLHARNSAPTPMRELTA